MNIEAASELLIHPLLWRLTGFVSSIVGFTCYALSSSFRCLFGHRSPKKMVVYSMVSSLFCIFMLYVKRCSGRHGKGVLLKAQVGFMVLALTSLWSVLEDRFEERKVEKGYEEMMNITSSGAFALMAMSLSRQLQLGFDVGMFNFLIGCFLVTVMNMSLKLAPLAALFCYLLVNIRSISDFLLELRAQHEDGDAMNSESINPNTGSSEHNDLLEQHADGTNVESVDQNTDTFEEDDQFFAHSLHVLDGVSISSPL